MGLVNHFLGGLACSFLGRNARPGSRMHTARAVERRRKHLGKCLACRLREERKRQYLERLRGSSVPAASNDLTARLLARTGQLAAGEAPSGPGTSPRRPLPRSAQQRHSRPLQLAVRIAGGAAAATALLGGAAYVLGGSTPASVNDAFAADFTGSASAAAPASAAVAGAAVAGADWKLSGDPQAAPAGSLSREQLSALRAGGWSCPELQELGYHLVWARGGVAYGSEVLELRLTDGRQFATVLEQRAAQVPAGGVLPVGASPVNILTGHPAAEDGFVAAGQAGTATPRLPAALWVNRQEPFQAIYRTPAATFMYISDLPERQADDAVAALMHPQPVQADASAGGGEIQDRLTRGLERIAELLAR